jgi:P4 family phage/plasmid primase-like protien
MITDDVEERTGGLLNWYEEAGAKLVPVNRKTKKPVGDEWQSREHSLAEMNAWVEGGGSVGIQLGEVSDWLATGDMDSAEAEKLAPLFLPPTLCAGKGGSVSHWFYRSPGCGFVRFADLDGEVIMELLASNNGAGRQVVVEPSVHPDKGPYRWVGGFNPAAVAQVPKEELRTAMGTLAVAVLVARHLPPPKDPVSGTGGGRHGYAMALAGYMLRNGELPETVLRILKAAWDCKGAPREAFRDLEGIVRDTTQRIERDEPATGGRTLEQMIPGMPERIAKFLGWERAAKGEGRRSYAHTDMGNGERFADQHRNRARYCHPFGKWFIHDGRRFNADEAGGIGKLAKETVRGMYAQASAIEDEEHRKRLAKHARDSEARGRVDAMLHMAQSEDGIPVSPQDLDRDPWLLNVRNGTIDLKTGELRPHDPGDLITKLAPVEYDPNAPRDAFEAFLEQILPSEPLRYFVKRLIGYYLTADVSEQILAFAYGTGANGKSTLLNAILEVMGDYAKQAAPELLTVKQGTSHPTELADLLGKRFVPTIEVEDGKRLAESLVKQLTGSDWISARFMRQDFFQFKPTHKVVLAANHKPIVRGTDFAIWRRIKVIPFVVTIPPEEQDRSLPDKLRAELPGILAWAVEGCLEWQEYGLGEPEEVRAASEDYRTEMDVLAAFIDARCVEAKHASAKASKLYEAYRFWSDEVGEYAESQRRFGLRLAERGFVKEKVGVVYWHGIGLRHGDGNDPDGGNKESVPKGQVDLIRSTVDHTTDLASAKGPRDEPPANGHVSKERGGPSGPYGPNLGVNEGFLGHAGFTREIGPQGPQGPRRSTTTPTPQRSEPLTPEQVAQYQRLTSQGMKPELAIAEVRRARA